MNKNNENENKSKSNSQSFKDKIAMFNKNASKSQYNQLPSKKIKNSQNNKTLPYSDKEKNQNEKEINKKVKEKEEKKVLKIINQANNKNNLTDNKSDKEINQPIENSNFKQSISIISKKEQSKEKENENNNNDNLKENPEKQKEKKNANNIVKEEEIKKEKKDNHIKIEKNNKIQKIKKGKDKIEEKKIKELNKIKKEENKENFKNKEISDINEERKRSLTIQESLKKMNLEQKRPKETNKDIFNKEKVPQIITEEKLENENIDLNNNNFNITLKDKSENLTAIKEKINVNENVQKTLQNTKNEKQPNINEENNNNLEKNKTKNYENLKSKYQADSKEKNISFSSNKSNQEINNHNVPKKIDLQAIFKDLNLEDVNKKFKESSWRESIIMQQKEENLGIAKKTENHPSKINKDIFLQSELISENEEFIKDTFCDIFFLTSFSKDKCQIMENSNNEQAECNHPNCNILPAIHPEIIYKYPKKDKKDLEINNIAASVCFPHGIKLCYEDNEEIIKTAKNYNSSFTSQLGERFFVITYHFFLKKNNADFESEHNITPIKYEFAKNEGKEMKEFIDEKNKDTLENLAKKEYIYIPYCACLISKYPFIKQIEKSLESIVKALSDENVNKKDLHEYISYIVNSIPSPPYHSKILFPLAYNNKLLTIQSPFFKDINKSMDNPLVILFNISEENILILFKLLIFEQKILIIGQDIDLVSQIILNFVTLLYPFEWIHTYIPVMSEKMITLLQAFLPFFNGMDTILFKKAKPILEKAPDGVFIFNIDSKTFELNDNYKLNSKISMKNKIPNIPKNLESLILKELKGMKINITKPKDWKEILNIHYHLKNLFMQIFTELLYDYKKYSYIVDNFPVFNKSLLVKDKGKESNFYSEFTSTQLFQMFLQNSLIHPDDKEFYFEKRLSDYEEIKKVGGTTEIILEKMFEKFKADNDDFFKLNKTYAIKPYFIKEFKNFENNLPKQIETNDVVQFLSKHYNNQIYANMIIEGILPENKRIFHNLIELSNDNDPEKIEIYYTPNQKNKIYDKKNSEINTKKSDEKLKKIKIIEKVSVSKEEEIKKNDLKLSEDSLNEKFGLSEEEIDEIKDNIKEIMTRIYRSDIRKINEDKRILSDSLKTQFGKNYFINILSNGYKQDYIVKNLVNEFYYFFSEIIFNTLQDILKLDENEENMVYAMKLLKSCQYIGTTKSKKFMLKNYKVDKLLSDELYHKLENYTLFNNKRFLEIWIEDEMTKNELNLKKSLKVKISIFKENSECKLYVEHIYSLFEKLINIMIKIKIDNSTIYSNINELAKEYSLDENQKNQITKLLEKLKIHKS